MPQPQTAPDQTVALEILNQLGGARRLSLFTGATNFLSTPDSVRFRLPADTAKDGITHVTVRLNEMDTYDVTYQKANASQASAETICTDEGIYCDGLVASFERTTGLYLSF
ncbi:hypothetical protein ACU4GI_32630 [Cupriavidus basilensis]